MADDAAVGTVAWSNPGNAVSSNDVRASVRLVEEDSHYLKATNFGFTVPTTAFVEGVAVRIERSQGSGDGSTSDAVVQLVVSGTNQGQNKADFATAWTGTDTYIRYPVSSVTDLWDISGLTPAIVNASNFGCVLSATNAGAFAVGRDALVDHIEMTVYYIEPIARAHGTMKRSMLSERSKS